MRTSRRNGFTLVELLVVITIIGMLMAMIFPVLAGVLANVQIAACKTKQGEVARAVLLYENSAQRFPGYREPLPIAQRPGGRRFEPRSWIVAVLRHLETGTYDVIVGGDPLRQPKFLRSFLCPVGVATQDEAINYVANCGRADNPNPGKNLPDDPANGVFMQGGRMRLSDVVMPHRTILISENLQATKWTNHGEADVGIVWHVDATNPSFPKPDSKRINRDREAQLARADYDHARPSSNHPGGVVVAFCDHSTMFLSEDVDYAEVYCRLMMSDSMNAKEPGTNTLVPKPFRGPVLEEQLSP